MAYGYDCTSSQSLNSAQGVKCLWLLMHLVSVAELTRGLCLHMWTHPLSTVSFSVLCVVLWCCRDGVGF